MEEESDSDEYSDESDAEEEPDVPKPPAAIGKPVMTVGKNLTVSRLYYHIGDLDNQLQWGSE